MGVAFALGLVAILLLFFGIGSCLSGVIILVIRGVLKKKTHKKYKVALFMGVVPLIIGGIILVPLIIIGGFLGINVIGYLARTEMEDAYLSKYVNTGKCFIVNEEDIKEGADGKTIFRPNELAIEGKIYKLVEGLSVELNDKYRGKAVANLDNGVTKLTVFTYNHVGCTDLLCVKAKIFATEEQMQKLKDYYNHGIEFTYQYKYTKHASTWEEDLVIEDDVYLGLINYDTKYVEYCEKVPEGEFDVEQDYYIIQMSKDGKLERKLEVSVRMNGDITVRAVSNSLARDELATFSASKIYYVIKDDKVKQQLFEIADSIRKAE